MPAAEQRAAESRDDCGVHQQHTAAAAAAGTCCAVFVNRAPHSVQMTDSGGLAKNRLLMERKSWRKNKPFGFHARPETQSDG